VASPPKSISTDSLIYITLLTSAGSPACSLIAFINSLVLETGTSALNLLKKILSTADNYHTPVSTPKEGDWLYSQKECGQTFSQFLSDGNNKVSPNRKTIYINPLQNMDQQFLNNCLLYCQSFFYPMQVKIINIASLKSLHIESRI